jgi:4-amino-4-deoxy-L-arabinose transferase-like glycosyltransferase
MKLIKNINKSLIIFLFIHLAIWTLIPTISNVNLPLDTIEHLAWSTDLQFGYGKHPPLVAWILRFFYEIFGNQDWAYYFLSQIFVVFSFFIVFKFSEDFFKNSTFSLISIFLLEGIYFYNFTTPEFNVNICQLPFWSLSVLYFWKGIKNNKTIDWLLFGVFAGLGVLSKYLFVYLLISIDLYFAYLLFNKRINYKCFLSLITFLLILTPHLFWLVENNFATIDYALSRTGAENSNFFDHLIHPLIYLTKQIGILIPFFLTFLFLITKFKFKINLKDEKLLFLIIINIIPFILIFLTSMIMGVKIRTMWMTPFYLFFGVFIVYSFQRQINLKKLKGFISVFLILFILSPSIYLYISISQTNKRTDYQGKKIAQIVQAKWSDKYKSNITIVKGDEWHAGNLSYHLKSNPKWIHSSNDEGSIAYKNQFCSTELEEIIFKQMFFCLYGE